MPMPSAAACCGVVIDTSLPSYMIEPESGTPVPLIIDISVVLPAPFSPTSAWTRAGKDVEIDVVIGNQ